MNIDQALKVARSQVKNPAARSYLAAIPEAIELGGMWAFESQIRYVRCNLGTWRGESARECKKVIDAWLKERRRIRIAEKEKECQYA